MKTLKIIVIVIGVIILIPLVFALFISNEYSVSRDIVINKPNGEVFNYVRHLKNQDHFNKWILMDPDMKKEFSGADGAIGCVYSWDGEKAGKGEQQIVDVIEGERIETQLHFIEPFEGFATAQLSTEGVDAGKTKLSWGMRGENKYPMNFMNLFTNSVLGADLEESLQNLKDVLENNKTSRRN